MRIIARVKHVLLWLEGALHLMSCTTVRTVSAALRALEGTFMASETVDAWLARLESAAIDGPLVHPGKGNGFARKGADGEEKGWDFEHGNNSGQTVPFAAWH